MSRWSREWRNDHRVSLSWAPGSQRVEVGDHDPEFVSRPVGFAPPIVDVQERRASDEPVDMPLLWNGDQA